MSLLEDGNHISNGESLVLMNSTFLHKIWIEYIKTEDHQCCDCRWIFKIKTPNIESILLESQRRFDVNFIKKNLKKRYSNYNDDLL